MHRHSDASHDTYKNGKGFSDHDTHNNHEHDDEHENEDDDSTRHAAWNIDEAS
jgi:hypothetical protein